MWLFKRQPKIETAQNIIDEAVKEDRKREREEEKQRKIQEKQKAKEEKHIQRIQSIQRIQEKPKMVDFGKQVIEAPFEEVREMQELKKKGKKFIKIKADKSRLNQIKSERIEPEPQETLHLSLDEIQDLKRCPKCNSKLDKSKVFKEQGVTETFLRQRLKCKNIMCDFIKDLKIRVI